MLGLRWLETLCSPDSSAVSINSAIFVLGVGRAGLPDIFTVAYPLGDGLATPLPARLRRHPPTVADTEFVYRVEVSDALGTWPEPAEGAIEPIGVVDNFDGTETVTIRATDPLGDDERGFVRVTLMRVSG